jgi:hypothetical protein
VRTLTNEIGCYVLCDLDRAPIYVGQSVDGIRSRVNRHLTSARSDIIANRQIDVWEIAWVGAYPVKDKAEIGVLTTSTGDTDPYVPRSAAKNWVCRSAHVEHPTRHRARLMKGNPLRLSL